MFVSSSFIKNFINEGVNAAASMAYPAVVGALTGSLIKVGAPIGLLHGLTLGVYHEFVHLSLEQYFEANQGGGKGEIREASVKFLSIAMCVALFAIPFLITVYFGGAFTGFLNQHSMTQWVVTSSANGYGLIEGLVVYLCIYWTCLE